MIAHAKKNVLAGAARDHALNALGAKGFDIRFVSHAKSILMGDFPGALVQLGKILDQLSLPITEIIGSGGGETKFTQRLRKSLTDLGWKKHNFQIKKTVDGVPRESTSHEGTMSSGSTAHESSSARSNGTTRNLSSIAIWRASSDCTPKVPSASRC